MSGRSTRVTDDEATLRHIRIVSELIGLSISVYLAWTMFVPEYVKEKWSERVRGLVYDLGRDRRHRTEQAHLILNLAEIADACPHELGQEVSRLRGYHEVQP